jgi:hypothetical protein
LRNSPLRTAIGSYADHRPIEAGQLEVGSIGGSTRADATLRNEFFFTRGRNPIGPILLTALLREHLDVRTFLKVVIWLMAAVVGLFVWNAAPDFRPIITWVLVAAFVCYVLSTIMEATIKRLIGDELLELRRQSNATANRIDVLDRKVTAILRDALEQRRLR